MRSILLIIACILVIILAISKCNSIQENKKNQSASTQKKLLKDPLRLLHEEARIWPVHDY